MEKTSTVGLIEKLQAIILESGCTCGEVLDALTELKIHFAKKKNSLANATGIREANKFSGIKKYDV